MVKASRGEGISALGGVTPSLKLSRLSSRFPVDADLDNAAARINCPHIRIKAGAFGAASSPSAVTVSKGESPPLEVYLRFVRESGMQVKT